MRQKRKAGRRPGARFYGTCNHDAKAVYQRYIGWYDGNPAHLNRHKPMERATRYVDAFGAEAILEKAGLHQGRTL